MATSALCIQLEAAGGAPYLETMAIFSAEPALTIQSPLPPDRCVEALRAVTTPENFLKTLFLPSGTIIAQIKGDRFRLRQKKSYNNSFAPLFYGKFRPVANGTEIIGEFRMLPFVKVFMTIWLAGVFFGGGALAVSSLCQILFAAKPHDHAPLLGVLIPVLMMVFGFGLLRIGYWLGKAERENMTRLLQATFSTGKAPLLSTVATAPKSAAMSMAGPIIFFASLGILSLVLSLTGISNFQAEASNASGPQTHFAITHFQNHSARALALLDGLMLLFVAYGTWKRLYVAWILGFLLILFSAASFPFQLLDGQGPFSQNAPHPPVSLLIFALAGALAIGAYWAFWWYKKRDYFLPL